MLKGTDKECEITKASIPEIRKVKEPSDDFGAQRVYKKTSPNSVLTLYLGTRDVISRQGVIEPLRGVIYIDPKFVPSHKIYGQLTLTFRYGREDEEVMGLKFCNEAIIALKQIWPTTKDKEELSSLQQALIDRLGKSAYPFSLDVGTLAPPSVQLIPAKRYNGAPIGTSYDVRIHMADQDEERIHRRCMVKLGVRVIHKITSEAKCTELPCSINPPMMPRTLRLRLSPKALKLANKFSTTPMDDNNKGSMSRIDVEKGMSSSSSSATAATSSSSSYQQHQHNQNQPQQLFNNDETKGPEGSIDKPFLWTEGRVSLRAALNKSAYGHGEHISVTIDVRNDSRKIIRKIRIFAVQHVDVCMFSNGKFKNVVAEINETHLIKPGENHRKIYSLLPIKGPTKNWIAVEGIPSHTGNDATMPNYSYKIASSAPRGPQTIEERNVFAIYVSYYIKVKLTLSGMGGEVSLKLPYILGHLDDSAIVSSIISPSEQKLYQHVCSGKISGSDVGGSGTGENSNDASGTNATSSTGTGIVDGKSYSDIINKNGIGECIIKENMMDHRGCNKIEEFKNNFPQESTSTSSSSFIRKDITLVVNNDDIHYNNSTTKTNNDESSLSIIDNDNEGNNSNSSSNAIQNASSSISNDADLITKLTTTPIPTLPPSPPSPTSGKVNKDNAEINSTSQNIVSVIDVIVNDENNCLSHVETEKIQLREANARGGGDGGSENNSIDSNTKTNYGSLSSQRTDGEKNINVVTAQVHTSSI